ncbi:MAG: inositol monophosphatase [bacterium]|nr:inositol monophosphatase [bacterium]
MQENYEKYLQTALHAAKEAGLLIRHKIGQNIHIDKKGRINLVTEVDMASEELIRNIITSEYPEHVILGEEKGAIGEEKTHRWIVDPLDGTTNFAQGYPFFSVSIALEVNGQVVAGVVHDPTHEETFSAVKGQGAMLNGRPIHVSDHKILEESLLVTGFPYDISSSPDLHLNLFRDMVLKARGVRRDGSAALDLCYIACGRFDGYWELGLHPWDMAAGALIVTEAGGRMSDFLGEPHNLIFRDMVASNGLVHEEMLRTIAPYENALRASSYWTDMGTRGKNKQ